MSNTCRRHALISPNGMVPAFMVTDRDAADSAIFAKLCAKLPKGGGIAPDDSAYRSSDNCEAAVATGRDPFFEPKKNHTGKGTDTWAEMVRFWKDTRAGFTQSARPGPQSRPHSLPSSGTIVSGP